MDKEDYNKEEFDQLKYHLRRIFKDGSNSYSSDSWIGGLDRSNCIRKCIEFIVSKVPPEKHSFLIEKFSKLKTFSSKIDFIKSTIRFYKIYDEKSNQLL